MHKCHRYLYQNRKTGKKILLFRQKEKIRDFEWSVLYYLFLFPVSRTEALQQCKDKSRPFIFTAGQNSK